MAAVTIYGIKNCDTMKKARAWLDAHGVAYDFHDYKTAGIDRSVWRAGRRKSAGRRSSTASGTTFRKLADDEKTALNEKKAIALMVAQPTMIKRPVLDLGDRIIVGFRPETYAKAFPR